MTISMSVLFGLCLVFYPPHLHPIQGLLVLRTTSQKIIHNNSRPNSHVYRLGNKQRIIRSRNIRHEHEDNNHLLQAQQQRPSPLLARRRSRWQQRRIVFLPFSTILSRLLWSSTLQEVHTDDVNDDDNNMGDPFSNQTPDELLALAKALQDQATSIRSEAKAMELALQQTQLQRQVTKMTKVDSIISTLFSSLSKNDSIATTMESTTTAAESSRKSIKTTNLTCSTIEHVPEPRVIADRLRNGSYSQAQLLAVVDRLYDLQLRAMKGHPSITNTTTVDIPPVTHLQNVTLSDQYYADSLEALTHAAAIFDIVLLQQKDQGYGSISPSASISTPPSTLSRNMDDNRRGRTLEVVIRSRIKELQNIHKINSERLELLLGEDRGNRRNSNKKQNNRSNKESILNDTVESNSLWNNHSTTAKTSSFVPLWLPSVFLPYMRACNTSTLGQTEVEIIKKQVLLGSRFFMTSSESVPGAALFRGNIRSSLGRVENAVDNTTAIVFADIQNRLEGAGLGDKVQLFMMVDPESEPTMQGSRPAVAAIQEVEKPLILAMPKSLSPDESKIKKSFITRLGNTLCYPLTALSIIYYSISVYALSPKFFEYMVNGLELKALYTCIPVAVSTLVIQAIHEAAHYLIAKRENIKIGPPLPIPSFHVSTMPFYGCITTIRSFPRNRAALLDFALSGPLSAIVASLGLIIGGALLTVRASSFQLERFPVMSVAKIKSSFLLGSIVSWLVPKIMILPLAQPVPMHPFFVVGASSLISNALNLLPIFRLDGGRACFAAIGQRQGAVISVFTLLLIFSMDLNRTSAIMLTWTMMIALLQRRPEIPSRDDVTEVDGKRLALWLMSFLLSLSILAPFPGSGLLDL